MLQARPPKLRIQVFLRGIPPRSWDTPPPRLGKERGPIPLQGPHVVCSDDLEGPGSPHSMGQDWAAVSVSLCNYSNVLEINQNHGHLPAGPKSEAATLPFTAEAAVLSPRHLHQQAAPNHPARVHNGAEGTSQTSSTSVHVCSLFRFPPPPLSPSTSWGTLTHPPKPSSDVPFVLKPSLPCCSTDDSPHISQDTFQVHNPVH